jgi:hypothetical protein
VRSQRELWLWLGGFFLALAFFLAMISIAYFEKDVHYSLFFNGWMPTAGVAFLAAFTCFFGASQSWSFQPPAKPGFPGISIEIFGTGSMDTERDAGTGLAVPAHLRSISVRITNGETGQDANLTVLLYVRLVPGSWGRVGEASCPPVQWDLSSLSLSPMSMPFTLAPGNAIGGHLVYEVPGYYLDKISEPLSARLELWDHLTDKRMSVPAEIGSYDNAAMTESSGEAEILGPEYSDAEGTPARESAGS